MRTYLCKDCNGQFSRCKCTLTQAQMTNTRGHTRKCNKKTHAYSYTQKRQRQQFVSKPLLFLTKFLTLFNFEVTSVLISESHYNTGSLCPTGVWVQGKPSPWQRFPSTAPRRRHSHSTTCSSALRVLLLHFGQRCGGYDSASRCHGTIASPNNATLHGNCRVSVQRREV